MSDMSDIHDKLKSIGLHYLGDNVEDVIALATKRRWSPAQLLEYIVEQEAKERARRSLERRTKRSKLGRFKSMADFDWKWPKKLNRKAVESALALDFMEDDRNVVLIAPQGLGKTMIAKNIVHNAVLKGRQALFITAADLLLDLTAQESARALDRRLKYYARISCLCIDEIGYLSYEVRNADLLFRVVTMRYEQKSLVLTTNLRFAEWPTIFPGAACTTALIDRIVHHANIIPVEGSSYRLRDAKKKRQASPSAEKKP